MRQFILLLLFLGFEHLGIGRRAVLGLAEIIEWQHCVDHAPDVLDGLDGN
jgi:hypothetical protein